MAVGGSRSALLAALAALLAVGQGGAREAYGFYAHAFEEGRAVVQQLRDVRKTYPEAPVFVLSDGGFNFSAICDEITKCKFVWKPPANDRWNPKPFFLRFVEAARWLDTDFIIMLEPDTKVQRPIHVRPLHDAGGLNDTNPPLHKATVEYVEALGRRRTGNSSFSLRWKHFGLAGGMYVRREAALDAFGDPDEYDWAELRRMERTHRVYSSDLAMCLALASKGYTYYPWAELGQKRYDKDYEKRAFRHYGREEQKPFYPYMNQRVPYKPYAVPPSLEAGQVRCQGCVNASEEECWARRPVQCPTTGPRSSLLALDNDVDYY